MNPAIGLEHLVKQMIDHPTSSKNIAIIGGGPAGMEAALVAANRGHKVTLYERSDALGGQLKHAGWASFKWPLRNFKDYLIRQVNKAGVVIKLNTEATAAMIEAEGYDAVLAAVGADPILPKIPGANGENVVFAEDVFGKASSLAENVVVIGGGETGVEAGMHLAENGHQVTVLEMRDMLAADAPPVFYRSVFQDAWEKLENFGYILNARCTGITADGVAYIDTDGAEQSIKAGSVVIAVGTKARTDEAWKFFGSAGRFYTIGDCNTVGNVQKSMRSAFSIASTL